MPDNPPNVPNIPPNQKPGDTDHSPIQKAWLGFVGSVRVLLVPLPEDRPMDQYLAFRNRVLEIVQGDRFLGELELGWVPFTDFPRSEIGDALLMELKAFPLAVEVAQATEKSESRLASWIKKLLPRASTVAGSVDDLIENLPPYAKNAITLFKELIDLFKRRE